MPVNKNKVPVSKPTYEDLERENAELREKLWDKNTEAETLRAEIARLREALYHVTNVVKAFTGYTGCGENRL